MKKMIRLMPFLLLVSVIACKKNNAPQTPAIHSFAPASVLPGDTVTITGKNFSPVSNNNIVRLNTGACTVIEAASGSIKIIVPVDARTGKLSVTVDNNTAASTTDLIVLKDIPHPGLVVFYPFNGNANDGSNNKLNGIPAGVTWVEDRFGNPGKAALFNGAGNYIRVANAAPLQISGSITIACWIKVSALKTSSVVSRFCDPNISTAGFDFDTDNIAGNGTFGLNVKNPAPGIVWTIHKYAAGEWVFIACTLDGTVINYYINDKNILSSDESKELINCSAADLIIGSNYAHSARYFDGVMDDLAIYNRALSENEVMALYNQTITTR